MKKCFKVLIFVVVFCFTVTIANAVPNFNQGVTITFINAPEEKQGVAHILTAEKDDSFDKIRDFINKKYINIKLRDTKFMTNKNSIKNDILALPVELIEYDNILRETLKDFIANGKRIYLYGNSITIQHYEELLGIKGQFSFENDPEKLKKESAGKAKYGTLSSKAYNVIGYSTKSNDSIYCAEFNLGDSQKPDKFMFMRAVLDDQLNAKQELLSEETPIKFAGMDIPFFKQNNVSAQSTAVKSSFNTNTYTYIGSLLAGTLNTDWFFFRDMTEKDSDYDWMTAEVHYEATGSNGFTPMKIDVKHDLVWKGIDNINDWGPNDMTTSNLSFSIPWGLTVSVANGGKIVVDECGSQANEYGRWIVKYPWYNTCLSNPTRFKPATAWLSSGTYAGLNSIASVTFNSIVYGYAPTLNQTIQMRYDY